MIDMAESLRIAIASWAPFHAGAEVAAERLALGLQAEGHEVLVVLGTDGETLRRMRQVGLHCEFLPLMLTDKWRMWRWAGRAAGIGADISPVQAGSGSL